MLARIERLVEALSIKSDPARVLFEIIYTEQGLVLKQERDVLPVLALIPRRLGCFGCFGRIWMLRERIIPHDKPHPVAIFFNHLFKHRLGLCATWALEIGELDYCDRRLLVAFRGLVICGNAQDRRLRRSKKNLYRRSFSQSIGKRRLSIALI